MLLFLWKALTRNASQIIFYDQLTLSFSTFLLAEMLSLPNGKY